MSGIDGIRPYKGDKPYIFVSYAHLDKDRIAGILRRLIEAGYRVWYDEGIDPGTEWDANIATHIEGCSSFVAFISANYLNSDNCKDELNFARDLRKERLLVYLEDTQLPSGMAMRLNRLQAIHRYTYSDPEAFYEKLFSVPHFEQCRGPKPTPPASTEPSLEYVPAKAPRIVVFGVGGAGLNTLNRMVDEGLKGVTTIAVNTDMQALSHSKADAQILIGMRATKGLGAGANPEIGRQAAEESRDAIIEALRDADMAFITCGFGGGTGTGAAPVIARIARDMDILTLGVVSLPFRFESRSRTENARAGLVAMQQSADMVVVLHNDKLLDIIPRNTTMSDSFRLADQTLYQGVRAISDLAVSPGIVKLEMNDLRSALRSRGLGYIGVGVATGAHRVQDAARQAVANPLLGTSLGDARQVLVNITADSSLTVAEVDDASGLIAASVDSRAAMALGTAVDDDLNDAARVIIFATDIKNPA